MNKWFGFWFRLICGILCFTLVGMFFYHGDGDSIFAWGFFALFGTFWLLGAYLVFLKRKKGLKSTTPKSPDGMNLK